MSAEGKVKAAEGKVRASSAIPKDSHYAFLRALGGETPRYHVVLGSGFGKALQPEAQQWRLLTEFSFQSIPHLSASTVSDHAGVFYLYEHLPTATKVLFQSGRLHGYEGHSPAEVVLPVLLSRSAGCDKFVLTNAAGGLKLHFRPGDVMVIRDHVNWTGQNPLVGENPKFSDGRERGPRFPDMSDVYDVPSSMRLKTCFEKKGVSTHEGVYLGVLGPSFETPAEIRLFSQWGMSAVGMSTVWEAIALSHSGANVTALSLISNLGAGLTPQKLEHENIVETCRLSASKIVDGLMEYLVS